VSERSRVPLFVSLVPKISSSCCTSVDVENARQTRKSNASRATHRVQQLAPIAQEQDLHDLLHAHFTAAVLVIHEELGYVVQSSGLVACTRKATVNELVVLARVTQCAPVLSFRQRMNMAWNSCQLTRLSQSSSTSQIMSSMSLCQVRPFTQSLADERGGAECDAPACICGLVA
jgi:hypothetical protein